MDKFQNSTDDASVPTAGPGLNERRDPKREPSHGCPNESPALTASLQQFQPGDLIDGRFAVIRFIACGGIGEVYEVEDRQLPGVHGALKTILSQYAADPLMRLRFEREVLTAREVVHPNLCPMYDVGYWKRPGGELTYLTMKLLDGESLATRLARHAPLPDEEARCILMQVGYGRGLFQH